MIDQTTISKDDRCYLCRGSGLARLKRCRECKRPHPRMPCQACNGTGQRSQLNPAWFGRYLRRAVGHLREAKRHENVGRTAGIPIDPELSVQRDQHCITLRTILTGMRERLEPEMYAAFFGDAERVLDSIQPTTGASR